MRQEEEKLVQAEALSKRYRQGGKDIDVLNALDFSVYAGEAIAIIGRSGSGKSTLLHLLGGLDAPDAGDVRLNGQSLSVLTDSSIANLRSRFLGFVYQFHFLLAELSAVENVMVPLLIGRRSWKQAKAMSLEMLKRVGLEDRVQHFPATLSGGECQRVALARALVHEPQLVLADEPTGGLDNETAEAMHTLMISLTKQFNTAFVVVTHNMTLLDLMDRSYTLESGKLKST